MALASRSPFGDWGASREGLQGAPAPRADEAGREPAPAAGPPRPRRPFEAPRRQYLGSAGGRGSDFAQRRGANRRRLPVDASALGADQVIPVRRGRWTAAAAAQARVVARMRERGASSPSCARRSATADSPSAMRRTCCQAHASARSAGRRRRENRSRGGTDRAGDDPARDADGARGDPRRTRPRGDRADGGCAQGLPLVTAAWSGSTRSRSARSPRPSPPLPSLRPRAADPPGRRRARDGRGDGAAGR